MLIRILAGAYGHRPDPEKSYIDKKDKNSEPFEVSDEEAARLIQLGIAESISTNVELQSDISVFSAKSITQNDLEQLSIQKLRIMAKDLGLPANGSKAVLADKIRTASIKLQEGQEKNGESVPDENDDTDVISDNEIPPFLQAAEPEV